MPTVNTKNKQNPHFSGRAVRERSSAWEALYVLLSIGTLLFALPHSAQAQSESLLHSFSGTYSDPFDGVEPVAAPVLDSAGNIYGTTYSGGTFGYGTVFKVTPAGSESLIYSFSGGSDGGCPYAGLFRKGKFYYGTTTRGGASGYGSIFKITSSGTLTPLYSFTGETDGSNPVGGVIVDSSGNIYGTTQQGGGGAGVIFELTSAGAYTVLHAFTYGGDGYTPYASVVMDRNGNLYGTTGAGGTFGQGTVYEVTAGGIYSTIYSFQGNADGAEPVAPLILDKKNNLYGTTSQGGTFNQGTVFRINLAKKKETVLYTFGSVSGDGTYPVAPLIFDQSGHLWGTTKQNGPFGGGTVFKASTTGGASIVYAFNPNNGDGSDPAGGLALSSTTGSFYGVTASGGAYNDGTVFVLTP